MNYRIAKNLKRLFHIVGLCSTIWVVCSFAGQKTDNSWKIGKDLVSRLGAEWYKVGVLSHELTSLSDVLTEMTDIELYPSELTGLDDTKLLQFDNQIQYIQKKQELLQTKVNSLKSPLTDALSILREMVINEPVDGMIKVLETSSFKRINQMLEIKQQIDTLWKECDSILNLSMDQMGISIPGNPQKENIDNDFIPLIKSNLGLQSEQHYEKLNRIKDYLIKKGNNATIEEMYQVEKVRIKSCVDQKKYSLALSKLKSTISRYESKKPVHDLHTILANVLFYQKQYADVIKITNQISDTLKNETSPTLLKIQSLYALKEYDIIWNEYPNIDFSKFSGAQKNLLIWIIIESGLAQKSFGAYSQLASYMNNNAPYAIHVLHALSQTYLQSGDFTTALSILNSTQKLKINNESDRVAQREVRIAIAQIYYEAADYEKSISLFYQILDEQQNFDRALIGIVWCYIRTDQIEKAESVLKKLINQMPESVYAVEALYILSQRYLAKANFEWKKVVHLKNEETRLNRYLETVKKKEKSSPDMKNSSKFEYAKYELTTLLSRLQKESIYNYDSITILYNNIEKISNMITTHYHTGFFQDVSFSKKREQTLVYLDSLINEISGQKLSTPLNLINDDITVKKIKQIVENSNFFSAIAALDRFKWEKEYIDWQKRQLKQSEVDFALKIESTSDSVVIKSLQKKKAESIIQIDSILAKEQTLKSYYFKYLTEKLETLLKKRQESSQTSYIRYHLGELYYSDENLKYTHEYNRYEANLSLYQQKLTDFRNGKIVNHPQKPDQPKLDHAKSIVQFKSILAQSVRSDITAPAYYSLGWCYNDMGLFDSALYYMEMLAEQFPTSAYSPQAWMYSGEYYFEKGNLADAIKCYQSVMKHPESDWFDEALYKLAWSQYRLLNPQKAISSFLALVDLGNEHISGSSMLEKESMDYIAISFSESDEKDDKGLDRAITFAKKLGDSDKGCMILHRLASVYRDQGRYDMAKKTYRSLLKTYPKYSKNPIVEAELLALVEKDISQDEINNLKIAYFNKYNKNSTWSQTQSAELKKTADSLAAKQLHNAAIGFHQFALHKNDSSIYQQALNAYRTYITIYPLNELANECHYNLAEIQFSLGSYKEAAEEYIAVSKRYPDSKYRETAAWNAIVASQNLLKEEKQIVKQ